MKLKTWERKMLRKIFKETKTEDGRWRRKTIKEIKDLKKKEYESDQLYTQDNPQTIQCGDKMRNIIHNSII
jgi:hypothetical protein